ncbi:insulin-like growth factor-binding protein 1 [Etheostoma cragini]|uniref:insulin-like growth factor-binding protein 1 n=1 Tax=Etheostoma cragini TaxID=417921 RepID=UPI00155ED41B|nr:insulin-like growth factor-binding protein 1 [Etheostoma cragini]XP_034738519.1 insulin-like growth factor-binding protein 1 [Etheostoma cragini]XP_034738520.1 insulin-like growth factor-binding protein 1 [Etheostoma cragini]XP_034738521.1 insulin-like growth factor-binding protein 1 [Etheostoma cragini]
MLSMGGLHLMHVVVAAVCSVLATGTLGSPVVGPEPIRCAPCSPEKLSQCPEVAPGCAEVLREPGCGCCLACALKAEELCGIYTAPCGSGLRCTPRPGDPRPLHSLTRGQAVCTESTEPKPTPEPQPQDQGEPEAEMENAAIVADPGSSHYLPGHSKPYDPRAAADAQESMKAKLLANRKKMLDQAPCHVELQRAMEKIAKSQQKLGDKLTRFYLPNCDKHGLYKPKQCESSLDGLKGRCWCVNSWNGKQMLGWADLPAEAECP